MLGETVAQGGEPLSHEAVEEVVGFSGLEGGRHAGRAMQDPSQCGNPGNNASWASSGVGATEVLRADGTGANVAPPARQGHSELAVRQRGQ